MLEMTYISFVLFMGLSGHIVFIKFCYFKHEAICLDWSLAYKSIFITNPLYEYILVENLLGAFLLVVYYIRYIFLSYIMPKRRFRAKKHK